MNSLKCAKSSTWAILENTLVQTLLTTLTCVLMFSNWAAAVNSINIKIY